MKFIKLAARIAGGIAITFMFVVGAGLGYEKWQNALQDVMGLKCTFKVTDNIHNKKGDIVERSGDLQHAFWLLRKRHKDEAANGIWTQNENETEPRKIFQLCTQNTETLTFIEDGSDCSLPEAETTRIYVNRKLLSIEETGRFSALFVSTGPCEEMTANAVREAWRKSREEKIKGNRL